MFLPVAALPQWELSVKVVQWLDFQGPWWQKVCRDMHCLCHRSYGPIGGFCQASCNWRVEGLFGQSFSIAPPIQALRGLPCLGSFSVVQCVRHIEGVPAGSQHGRSHPWQGHVERPDGQGESGLKGSAAWASTPKPKSVCLLSAILYSSDITGGYPWPPFSGKS